MGTCATAWPGGIVKGLGPIHLPPPPLLIPQALVNPDVSGRRDLHRFLDGGFEFVCGSNLSVSGCVESSRTTASAIPASAYRPISHSPAVVRTRLTGDAG